MPSPQPDIVIRVQNVTKSYRLYQKPVHRLLEVLTLNRRAYHREFTALRDVTLNIRKGETLGVVGPNGAGKSTLLKVVAGIIDPTEGLCKTQGRVAAIIELGAGFHPEFSGRENVVMNATLLGFKGTELQRLLERVERFSELGRYLDLPLKTYSTGMFMRLAFSVAINVEPDILLIDEALAVGDAVFSHRCISRIRQLQERGITIMFVSHDVNSVMTLCNRAVYIDKGNIVEEGAPRDVIQRYHVAVAERLSRSASEDGKVADFFEIGAPETSELIAERRIGTMEAHIIDFMIFDEHGKQQTRFNSGAMMRCRISADFAVKVRNPVFGIMIKNRYGVEVFGSNSFLRHEETGVFSASERAVIEFTTRLELCPGVYSLSFAIHTAGGHMYDYRHDVAIIEVLEPEPCIGIARLPLEVSWRKEQTGAPIMENDIIHQIYRNAPHLLIMNKDAAQFIVGDWYLPESCPEGWFRWMGEEASVYLTKPANPQRFFYWIRTFHPAVDSGGLIVRVTINGIFVDEQTLIDNNWHRFECDLKPGPSGDVARVTLSVGSTFRPAGEERALSIQCRECGFQ